MNNTDFSERPQYSSPTWYVSWLIALAVCIYGIGTVAFRYVRQFGTDFTGHLLILLACAGVMAFASVAVRAANAVLAARRPEQRGRSPRWAAPAGDDDAYMRLRH